MCASRCGCVCMCVCAFASYRFERNWISWVQVFFLTEAKEDWNEKTNEDQIENGYKNMINDCCWTIKIISNDTSSASSKTQNDRGSKKQQIYYQDWSSSCEICCIGAVQYMRVLDLCLLFVLFFSLRYQCQTFSMCLIVNKNAMLSIPDLWAMEIDRFDWEFCFCCNATKMDK